MRIKHPLFFGFLALLVVLFATTAEAFMFSKIVYCSPVEGIVLWEGKPVAGLTVTRDLTSGGFKTDSYSDQAISDSQGNFRFSEVSERRFLRPDLLSGNPKISQLMDANFQGKKYSLWVYAKRDFYKNSEARGGVIKLVCDLANFEEEAGIRFVKCKDNRNPEWN